MDEGSSGETITISPVISYTLGGSYSGNSASGLKFNLTFDCENDYVNKTTYYKKSAYNNLKSQYDNATTARCKAITVPASLTDRVYYPCGYGEDGVALYTTKPSWAIYA